MRGHLPERNVSQPSSLGPGIAQSVFCRPICRPQLKRTCPGTLDIPRPVLRSPTAIEHRLAYVHMPVPVDRSDDAFHRPLRDLKLGAGTELFLGVVHARDGVEGTRARMAAARRYVPEFGIAMECGMARARSEATVRALLKIHAEVCGDA